MRQPTVGLLLALGALLACISGCNDEDGPRPCDWNHVGAVHGYVLAAGQPPVRPVSIWLTSTEDHYSPLVSIGTSTDSTGWYEFLVPEGDYFLRVRTSGQEGYYTRPGWLQPRSLAPDTLTVTRAPLRADLHLGAVTFDLSMPAMPDSEWIRIEFDPADDKSLEHGYVSGWTHDGHWRPGTVSLAPGIYRLGLEVDDQEFWLPGTLDPGQATLLEVGNSTPAHYAGTLNAPWILAGEIRGPWQPLGLRLPTLTAMTTDSMVCARTTLAADGSFRMALYLPVPIRLLVGDSYDPWRWIGGMDFASAGEFTGAPGESLTVPSCIYSGLECQIEPPEPAWSFLADFTLLDASGRTVLPVGFRPPRRVPLTIPCLDPGTYFLRLEPRWSQQTWCAQWFSQADELEDATRIEVPPDGGIARITAVLSACGSISGRVLKPDGLPAGGRRVELLPVDDPTHGVEYSPIYTVTDGETGEFALRQLHDGVYHIGVRDTLTTLVWYPGTLLWDEAAVLTLTGHGEITGLEWSVLE